jgi:nucleoside-diphosphate-sugar epimerase
VKRWWRSHSVRVRLTTVLRDSNLRGALVLLSVPTLHRDGGQLADPTARIVEALGDAPARVVYLSTTGVYGNVREVNETTPAAPATERQRLRLEAEQAVLRGAWQSLILRPAAIYGPGRGAHVALREGRFPLAGEGSNFISRIHVDDLAALAAKALRSEITGAYPVADQEPCTSREIAEFSARLLGVPMPPSVTAADLSETRRSDRRVDGSAIFRLLGVELRYPSFRQGIPAALAEEKLGCV